MKWNDKNEIIYFKKQVLNKLKNRKMPTSQATYVMEKYKKDITPTMIFEEVKSHDGYNELGPKSDIWDFYWIDVRPTDEETRIIKHFHRENWFWGREEETYALVVDSTITLETIFKEHAHIRSKIQTLQNNLST
jgi:hypothetical protein